MVATCMVEYKYNREIPSLECNPILIIQNTLGKQKSTNAEMIQAMSLDMKLGMEMNTKEWLKALKHAKLCV